jgi:hypothetical protein
MANPRGADGVGGRAGKGRRENGDDGVGALAFLLRPRSVTACLFLRFLLGSFGSGFRVFLHVFNG